MKISIVILTYNRPSYINKVIETIVNLSDVEIIIVDNNSDEHYVRDLENKYENITGVFLDRNYGAVARNFGFKVAKGDYVICLDDDVWGISEKDIIVLQEHFNKNPKVAAICFKVIGEDDGKIINWMHHRDKEKWQGTSFETYEISEGAVVFRREILDKVGYYPLEFFISHEGPDLALRIINFNYKIIYLPDIAVTHAHALEGRKNWRRYYYDTRNLIWLAYRNYNIRFIIIRFSFQLIAMLLYSIRDGFLRYFLKAVYDGVLGLKQFKGKRNPISNEAYNRIRDMDKYRPSIFYYVHNRLFKKGIKL